MSEPARGSSRERMGGEGAVLSVELERARRAGVAANAVILVEGASDRRALATLARRQGRDLAGEGVTIVATTGITNVGRFLDVLGPGGHDVALKGLVDESEAPELHRALESAGLLDPGTGVADLGELGFHVCVRDLEDELIRALGADAMLEVIDSQGHLRRFHGFQNQPAQRHKTIERQLWRWLGNHKIRYAPLMVAALDLERVPRPLSGVLAHP